MTPAETKLQEHLKAERRLARELAAKHTGQWVAIREHRLIAEAESFDDLHGQLAQEDQPYRSFRVVSGDVNTLR